jgi:hypothetical protein
VLEHLLRALAILTSLVVIAGWSAFAIDETRGASQRTQAEIAGERAGSQASPTTAEERARERVHSPARETIDDLNDVLLRPFVFVTDGSPSQWVRRSVSAILALLLYGFALGWVARFAHGHAHEVRRRARPAPSVE